MRFSGFTFFRFYILISVDDCFPSYKRMLESALHGILNIFRGLLFFGALDTKRQREEQLRERECPERFLSFDALERRSRGGEKSG